jgi:hypothetical protein
MKPQPRLCGPYGYRALGFKEAGDLIVQQCMRKHQPVGYFMQPILQSYRQYLELEIKHVLTLTAWLLDVDRVPPETTSLLKLWFEGRARLYEIDATCLDASVDEIERMEQCLAEFDQLDDQSDAFGFPFRRPGQMLTATSGPDDLGQLRESIAQTQSLLESFSMHVHDAIVRKETIA